MHVHRQLSKGLVLALDECTVTMLSHKHMGGCKSNEGKNKR